MPAGELPGQVAHSSTVGSLWRSGRLGEMDPNVFNGVCVDDQTSGLQNERTGSKKKSSADEVLTGDCSNGHASEPPSDSRRNNTSNECAGLASPSTARSSMQTIPLSELLASATFSSELHDSPVMISGELHEPARTSIGQESCVSFASSLEEDAKPKKTQNYLRKLSRRSVKLTGPFKKKKKRDSNQAIESTSRLMLQRQQTQHTLAVTQSPGDTTGSSALPKKSVGFDVSKSQEEQIRMTELNSSSKPDLNRSNSFADRALGRGSKTMKRMSTVVSAVANAAKKPMLKRAGTLDIRDKLTRTNCAMVFSIRSERGTLKEQLSELQQMLHVFGPTNWRLSLVSRWGVRYQIVLKCLAFYTLMFAPLQLAVESTCTGNERSWFACLKCLQFACSLVYAVGALPARFVFSVVDLNFAVELYDMSDLIAYHIRRPQFWLDLVSAASLPFEIYHLTQEPVTFSMTQVLIAVLSLCRSWRCLSDAMCVGIKGIKWRRRLHLEVLAKFGNLVLFLHLIACAWALLGVSQVHGNYAGWRDGMSTGCFELYTESIYFMTTTVTSVGYGDVLAANALERLMCVAMMIVGQMLCAEILAHINWVTSTANFARAEHISKVTKTCASLESLRVSPHISARVLAFLHYSRMNRNSMALIDELGDLSYPLRTELLLTTYYDLVIACPFFKSQPFEVILFIVHCLQDHAYLPGDVLFRVGAVATKLFFIQIGEVAILAKAPKLICEGLHAVLDDEVVSRLSSGDYFGEMCAVSGSRHTTTAVTASYARLSVLQLGAIQVLERLHPEGFLVLVRTAQQMNNTRVTISWARVWSILNERFGSHEEAFAWIADADDDDIGICRITGVQFVDGLSKLGVPRFDAQVLWANAEAEKTNPEAKGFMTCEEFCQKGEEEHSSEHSSESLADAAELCQEHKEHKEFQTANSRTCGKLRVGGTSVQPKSAVDPAVIKREFEEVQAALKKVFIATGTGQRPSLLSRSGLLYQRTLRQLAVITVLIAPWQLGFEASCQDKEQGIALALKIVLLVCSLFYTLLALPGRCFFAVTNVQLGIELQGLDDIIAHELANWRCWLDIAAALSFPLEIYQLSQQPTSPTWVHGLMLVSVFRSWRIFQPDLAFHSRVQVTKEALWLFWLLLLQIHFFACAWGLIGVLQWHARERGHPMQDEDWVTDLISRESLLFSDNPGCTELYVLALYWSGATITAVGYGDIVAVNPIEHIVAVTTELAGMMFIAEVFARLNWSTSTNRQINAEHISKVSRISAALDNLQVTKALRDRVLALTEYAQACQQEKVLLPVMEELSPPLQLMVRSSLYSDLMRGCPFFRSIEQDTIDLVIKSLEDVAYLPNDFVFREGDMGDDMYFIRTGEVRLIKRDKTGKEEFTIQSLTNNTREIKRLKPGMYFGELAALMGGARRKLCSVSTGYSILSVLNADAFKILEQEHPAPFVTLVRAAQELLKASHKPVWSWDDAAEMVISRFQNLEEAFDWIQGDSGTVDIITIANFTAAFSKLGVDRFNAHALWLEADKESKGVIHYSDFQNIILENTGAINNVSPESLGHKKLSLISGKNVRGQERLDEDLLSGNRSLRASFGTTNIVVTAKSLKRQSIDTVTSVSEGVRVSTINVAAAPHSIAPPSTAPPSFNFPDPLDRRSSTNPSLSPSPSFFNQSSGIGRNSNLVSPVLGASPGLSNGAGSALGRSGTGGRLGSVFDTRVLDPKLSRLSKLQSPPAFPEPPQGIRGVSVRDLGSTSLMDASTFDAKMSRLQMLGGFSPSLSPIASPRVSCMKGAQSVPDLPGPHGFDDISSAARPRGTAVTPPALSPRQSRLSNSFSHESNQVETQPSTLTVPFNVPDVSDAARQATGPSLMIPRNSSTSPDKPQSKGCSEATEEGSPKPSVRPSAVQWETPRASNVSYIESRSPQSERCTKGESPTTRTLASIKCGLGKSQHFESVRTHPSSIRQFFQSMIADISGHDALSEDAERLTMLRSDGGCLFELRMPSTAHEQEQQLDQMLYTESGPRRRYSLVGHVGSLYQRVLRLLAMITLLLAPWELGLEPASRPSERDFVLAMKVVQLITSVLYCVLALPGRMLFTVCDLTHCSEVHETGAVLRHLVRTHGFHLDVVALISVPFELVHLWEEPVGTPTVSQVLMNLSLLRAWRIVMPDVSIVHARTPIYMEVFWLLSILLMEIHLIACAWALLGLLEANAGVSWWLHSLDMTEPSGCLAFYIQSYYFVAYTVTGVGYGNLLPVNASERFVSVVIMIVGQMSIAEVFARLNWMTAMYKSIRTEHASRVRQLTEAMEKLQIDRQLEQRVIAYTEYCQLCMKESSVRKYFEDLSPPLLSELRLAVNHELVMSCPFFQNQPLMVVCLIVNLLREQAYLPYDFIFRQGDAASDLYMIRGGFVFMLVVDTKGTVFLEDLDRIETISELAPGNYFGEVGVLTGRPHKLSAMAQTYCILSLLSNSAFEVLEAEYAGCLLHLMRAAGEWIPELQHGAFSWQELADTFMERFNSIDDAFYWLSGESVTNILSLTSFKESLEVFGIPRHGALSLWANSGLDDACTMDLETFRELLIERASDAVKEAHGLRSKRESEAVAAARTTETSECQAGQISSQKTNTSKVGEFETKNISSDSSKSCQSIQYQFARETTIAEVDEEHHHCQHDHHGDQANRCVSKQSSLTGDKFAKAKRTKSTQSCGTSSFVKRLEKDASQSCGLTMFNPRTSSEEERFGRCNSEPVVRLPHQSLQDGDVLVDRLSSKSEKVKSMHAHSPSLQSVKTSIQKAFHPTKTYLGVLGTTQFENVMRVKQSDAEQDSSLARVLRPLGEGRTISLTGPTGIFYQKVLRFLSLNVIILVAFRLALRSACEDFEAIWVRMLEIAYYGCSGIFLLVALPGRFFFTVIDPRMGEEWFDFAHVSCKLFRSSELWLNIASGTGFALEYVLWTQDMEYTAPWCQMVVGLRLVGGWHALRPIQRTGTGTTQLTREVIRLLIVLFVTVHLLACSWSHFAMLESQAGQSNWIDNEETNGCFELYAASFYFSAYTITATGYGDILPANDGEMVLSIAIMIAGTFLIANIFAGLNRATSMHNFRRAQQIDKVSHLAAALENIELHAMFSSRVFAFLEYISLSHKDKTLSEYVEDLSPPLRAELRAARYDGLLRKCPFFASVPSEVLHIVINRLKDQVYLPQDFVYRAGDPSVEMFFIQWGQLAILPGNFKNSMCFEDVCAVKELHLGDYFGEIGVLTQEKRNTFCLAEFYCVLSTLDYTVFEDLQCHHPEFFLSLIRSVSLPGDSAPIQTWDQVSKLLLEHFGDVDTAFSYACLKAGLIAGQDQTIPVSVLLGILNRLGITTFQAQLLWAEIEFAPDSDCSVISYADFHKYCGNARSDQGAG